MNPTGTASLSRTRNFLPHCASISTEVGEWFSGFTADPPFVKSKKPFRCNGWAFRFIGAATWQRHCGNTRKFGTAVSRGGARNPDLVTLERRL